MTQEDKMELEHSCKDMLTSKIAYNWHEGEDGMTLITRSPSYLEQYVSKLGKKRVAELADELINKVDHIEEDTYTDSEGLTYNSIIWKED